MKWWANAHPIRFLAVFTLLVTASCSDINHLAKPPNLFVNSGAYPDAGIPAAERSSRAQLYYMTDRAPVARPGGREAYSSRRSSSMAFGLVDVNYGRGLSWSELKRASVVEKNRQSPVISVSAGHKLVRFSSTPLPFKIAHGVPTVLPRARARYDKEKRMFKAEIARALKRANRREVLIFVHGYRNSFNDGAATLANLWHFSGRIGVPILYSWPANNPGLFGYFKDRESGEFTIFHFKEFLRMLSEVPGLEKVHLIAHSRGADVATSALRELVIEERAAHRNPRSVLKISELVLAAPDLDFGVVRQRLIAEKFGPAFGQITVYMNRRDSALRLAQALMAGVRFGRLSYNDLRPSEKESFRQIKTVNFIDVEYTGGRLGHVYFRENPHVMSDIIALIRTSALPGTPARPLDHFEGNFWRMPADYPGNIPRTIPRPRKK